MSDKSKLVQYVLLFVLLMSACESAKQSNVTLVPSATATIIPTVRSTATTTPTPILSATKAPTATFIPVPSATALPTAVSIAPFQAVASLADWLDDSTEEVQLHVLGDDSIWIISSQSAIHWDGQVWEKVLPEIAGKLVSVDDKGNLWVMPEDTSVIETWQDGRWTIYNEESGWASAGPFANNWWAPVPWSVSVNGGRTVWVPLEKEMRSFDQNKWKAYSLADMGFPASEMEEVDNVLNISTLKDSSEVWVGECYYSGPGPMGGGGVRWFDGESWYAVDEALSSGCVSVVTFDQAGNLWLGISENILRYDHTSQSWKEYSLPVDMLAGFNFTHPRQIIVDQAADVWVSEQMCGGASCDGQANLYRIHDEEWSLIIEAAYWSSSFKQLVLDGNGQAWLFWEDMFYQLDDTPLKPISAITARGVDVSPDGRIWVVAGSGEDTSLQVLVP